MPYTLHRLVAEDGALIYKRSHGRVMFNAGVKFEPELAPPVKFIIDVDTAGRRMPTLFTTPTFVATQAFYDALKEGGVDNVDAYQALITNPDTGATFDKYLVLNIVGIAECADMEASDYGEIGPGMQMINRLVLRRSKMPDLHVFLLAEDINKIIVSDQLHDYLVGRGEFEDVYFGPVTVR